MITTPLVSIAIPTFNRELYLRKAVDSCLRQSYPNIEIIISNNCSNDSTRQYLDTLQEENITIINQTANIGMVPNWNACLQHAKGEFFLLLSDDDLLESSTIEKLVSPFIEQNSEHIGFSYCQTRIIDENDQEMSCCHIGKEKESAMDFIENFYLGNRDIFPCSIMFRTSDLKDLGSYNYDTYTLAADTAMWMNVLLKRGYAAYIFGTFAKYRVHSSNMTSTAKLLEWKRGLTNLIFIPVGYYKDNDTLSGRLRKTGELYKTNIICTFYAASARKESQKIKYMLQMLQLIDFTIIESYLIVLKNLIKLLIPNKIFLKIKKLLGTFRKTT